MDWNEYLYFKIKEKLEKNPGKAIFKISDPDENIIPLDNQTVADQIEMYSSILADYNGKICVIYHGVDEKLVGFIIAAFRCHVKILIRRTTLDFKEELRDDLLFLQEILPIQLAFVDENMQQTNFEMIEDRDGILILNTNDSNKENVEFKYDFIQLSSGTTDSSKAFCLTIEGLIKSAEHIQDVHHVSEESIFLSYLTLSHIYGFVSGFLLPLISGATGVFCKTSYIKNNPTLLFEILSSEKVTHASVIMNTLLLGLKEKNAQWDLSELVCASLGGEKVDMSTYEFLLNEMTGLGMPKNALVNSYGMSEKGSITMEDPAVGNCLYKKDNKGFVSVGNDKYIDTEIIVFDEKFNIVSEGIEGMIGVHSPYLSKFYFNKGRIYDLKTITIDNKEYYHNGDCGFINAGKVFVTGRKVNTITYNGLKIAAEILNESIGKLLNDYGVTVKRCFCFNYPEWVNYVVCFVDYDQKIENGIFEDIKQRVLNEYHVDICDFWVDDYNGHGIGKISLPDIITKYTLHMKEE